MIKVKTKSDLDKLNGLCFNIQIEAERIVAILDEHYNSHGYDGGCVVIAETEQDFNVIKNECVDYTTEPIEVYREVGCCVSLLFLPATEYSVSVLAHKDIVPKELRCANE
ncbi:MAG: hypothetical protein NC299_08325 [Lachnospiraceae bacterium]|nr:hypothetical protein [Ruminococcus sp.]MCM1275359.1 hypothetical protein [Lachnospiraceae bacterium]